MKKRLFKKITATVLALTMVVGMVNVVSAAHAPNGDNIAKNSTWNYFSILPADSQESSLDFDHNGHQAGEKEACWYHSLTAIGQIPNGEPGFATRGWVVPGATSSKVQFYAANTGWDGEYSGETLVGDNPWGLRLFSSSIPVEKGRTYTLSFKYTSDIKTRVVVYQKDENGDYKLDENGNKIPEKDENGRDKKEDLLQKHIGLSVINPVNKNGIDFLTYKGCSSSGHFVADASKGEQTISVTFQVPAVFPGNAVQIQFVLGSYMVTYPEELGMTGSLYLNDVKLIAGTQYSVKYTYGKQSFTEYVNPGAKATGHQFAVTGKTFKGYKKGSANYNLSTPVNSNTTLTCVYVNTPKPGKAKVKFTAQKKKVKLKLTKIKNCVGYEIKYANNKKMKKAKTKTTTKKTLTIKKLKSKKKTYFQVRGYNLDSAGKKVYSKKVLKKTVKVK